MVAETGSIEGFRRHRGPHLGVLALVFTALQLASRYPVSTLAGAPSFSLPASPASGAMISTFFQTHAAAVLIAAILQFGSAIPLGIFCATAVSRLRFVGVRAAGIDIALFGGLLAAFATTASASVLWVLAQAGVVQDTPLTQALSYLQFAFDGPGYTVPLGIFLAGICIPAAALKVLPRWLVGLGLLLAAVGEVTWISLTVSGALLLIPLMRFAALLWMIAAGFALPRTARGHPDGGGPFLDDQRQPSRWPRRTGARTKTAMGLARDLLIVATRSVTPRPPAGSTSTGAAHHRLVTRTRRRPVAASLRWRG